MDVEFLGLKSCASPLKYFNNHLIAQHCKEVVKSWCLFNQKNKREHNYYCKCSAFTWYEIQEGLLFL